MMISKKLNEKFNQQIGHEMGASNQYTAIACHFAGEGYDVLAKFFFKQAEEERAHAMRFVKYILETGGKVEIPAIPAPQAVFKDTREAVQLSLDWEKTVTQQINSLMDIAMKESDYLAQHMLGWFVHEQLEEVSTMENLLKVVERAGSNTFFVEQYLLRKAEK